MNIETLKKVLWDENTTKSRLGDNGYEWFVNRAERRIANCTDCNGSGTVMMPDPIGIWRIGLVSTTCPNCDEFVGGLIAFTKAYFETVPPAYRHITLRTLEPTPQSPVPLERQADIIAVLKANPDKSYAFFGKPGASKTVWATALYAEILYRQYMRPHPRWKWFPVIHLSLKKMLDQHAEYAIRRNDPDRRLNAPDVTAGKIRAVTQTGDKYRLFLEDMNGGEGTDRRRADLFDVINAIYENDGQLVITSNLTPAEFKRQYGDDLFWRITERCTVVEVFDGKDKK